MAFLRMRKFLRSTLAAVLALTMTVGGVDVAAFAAEADSAAIAVGSMDSNKEAEPVVTDTENNIEAEDADAENMAADEAVSEESDESEAVDAGSAEADEDTDGEAVSGNAVSENSVSENDTEANAEVTIVDIWSGGKTATAFASGEGTKDSPYIIRTPGQLAYFICYIKANNFSARQAGQYYELGSNIYINEGSIPKTDEERAAIDYSTWTKTWDVNLIENISYGDFYLDGKNHTIYGLKNSALFPKATGSMTYAGEPVGLNVQNLKIEAYYDSFDGGVGLSEGQLRTIKNVTMDGETEIDGYNDTDGKHKYINLIGSASDSIIKCVNNMNVNIKSIDGVWNGGYKSDIFNISGIGRAEKITSCSNNGILKFAADSGTVAGITSYGSSCSITNCVNNGYIEAQTNVYGIARLDSNSVIKDCINNGDIKSKNDIYGIGEAEVITGCVNNGNLTSTGSARSALGIGVANKEMTDCTNEGTLTADSAAGIFEGMLKNCTTYDKLYNRGTINGKRNAYGIGTQVWCNETDADAEVSHVYNYGDVISTDGYAYGLFSNVEIFSDDNAKTTTLTSCNNYGMVKAEQDSVGLIGSLGIWKADSGIYIYDCHNYGDVQIFDKEHGYLSGLFKGIQVYEFEDMMPTGAEIVIKDCSNEGTFTTSGTGYFTISGIAETINIREGNTVTISACVNKASMAGAHAYGLAESVKNATIEYCCNMGEIEGLSPEVSNSSEAVALVGHLEHGAKIIKSFNEGNVHSATEYASATLVERADENTLIEDCYNRGNLTATGSSSSTATILGTAYTTKGQPVIKNVYNTGTYKTSNAEYVNRGILSDSDAADSKVEKSNLYDLNTSGANKLSCVKYLSDADMKNQLSFAGFNFTDVWMMGEEADYKYPVIRMPEPGSYDGWAAEWDDINWSVENGVLTLALPEVEGASDVMPDVGPTETVPWYRNMSKIKKVVIKPGFSNIGNTVFRNLVSLETVEIPTTVKYIGQNVFANCRELSDIYYAGTQAQFGNVVTDETTYKEIRRVAVHFNDGTVSQKLNAYSGTFSFPETGAFGSDQMAKYVYEGFDFGRFFDEHGGLKSYYYDHEIGRMSIRMAMAGMDVLKVKGGGTRTFNINNLMKDLDFKNLDLNYEVPQKSNDKDDTIGTAIGSRILYNGTEASKTTLIAVTIRGGGYGYEWGSNVNVGASGDHAGFKKAANTVVERLASYIDKLENPGTIKVWINGYSRAAATTNLAAAMLDDGAISRVAPGNVYAYCFECPAGTVNKDAHAPKYNNIVSFINPKDIVPMVAMNNGTKDWCFVRYGKEKVFPDETYLGFSLYQKRLDRMRKVYQSIIDHTTNPKNTIRNATAYGVNQHTTFDSAVKSIAGAIDRETYYDRLQSDLRVAVKDVMVEGKGIDAFNEVVDDVLTMAKEDVRKRIAAANGPIKTPILPIIRGNEVSESDGAASGIVTDSILMGMFTSMKETGTEIVKGYKTGVAIAHYPELCLSWMDSLSDYELGEVHGKQYVYVNCPVDIEVYDEGGALVANIKNDEAVSIEGGLPAYIDANGQKVVVLPDGGNYDIKYIPTADGEMTVTTASYEGLESIPSSVNTYFNIDISKNQDINGVRVSGNEVAIWDSKGSEMTPDYHAEAGDFVKYSVDAEIEGKGFVNGTGCGMPGEFVKLSAEPDYCQEFLGWYEGDKLLSEDIDYRVGITDSDRVITAKFTTKNTIQYELDGGVNDLSNPATYEPDGEIITLMPASHEEYKFGGWYLEPEFENKIETINPVDGYDYILYARWIGKSSGGGDAIVLAAKQKFNIAGLFEGMTVDKYVVSPKGVATVNKAGLVTAKKQGEVTITAQKKEGNSFVELGCVNVRVLAPKFTKSWILEKPGEEYDLTSLVTDSPIVTRWESQKTTVATVDGTGKVTAVANGKTKITAYYGEGKNAAKYTMTVIVKCPMFTKAVLKLKTGKQKNLAFKNVSPQEIIDYTSLNPEVAQVDSTGLVTAIAPGEAIIEAVIDGVTYTCKIVVQ